MIIEFAMGNRTYRQNGNSHLVYPTMRYERTSCKNYKGTSLVSVASKLLKGIIHGGICIITLRLFINFLNGGTSLGVQPF